MADLTRRRFFAQAGALAGAPAQAASRANVLLIMTDQHRADALGAAGDTIIRTPNLDRLAKEGTRFTECWVQHPVSMPSRASIFTGRYPSAHRVRTNGVPLPQSEKTLAQLFLDNGYRTGGAGKFHFVPHLNRELPTMETHPGPFYGFQQFHIGEDGRRGEHGLWIKRRHPEYGGKRDNEIPIEIHNTHWTANHTIRFIRDCVSQRQSFFAFCSFVDPHHPYNPPHPYQDMYKDEEVPPPIARANELDDKPPFFKEWSERYRQQLERVQRNRSQYYGEVTFIDDYVGKILKTLEELGVRQNTLIIFTSDHGDMLGDHGLLYKGPFHYRGCANVPLIINWPGRVLSGKRVDGIVQEIDLLPTIADLVGLQCPPGVQGKSQKAVLTTDTSDTGYSAALIEHGTSGAAAAKLGSQEGIPDVYTLRSRSWRLSYYPGKEYGELYDLESDPQEFVNRWRDPGIAAVKQKLKDELLDRVLAARDPLPVREEWY